MNDKEDDAYILDNTAEKMDCKHEFEEDNIDEFLARDNYFQNVIPTLMA